MSYRIAKITENVVAAVAAEYPGRRIIYRDTEGIWDELVHKNGTFVDFRFLNGVLPE